MSILTRRQLYNGIINCGSKYVGARGISGKLYGFNVAAGLIGLRKKNISIDDKPTSFVSFRPITFQEYITIKVPFL